MAPALEEPTALNGVETPSQNGFAKQATPLIDYSSYPTPTYPTRSLEFLTKLMHDQEPKTKVPLQAQVTLRIIIVGAGLGGLACAIALARRGHKVTVLEQTAQLGEVCTTSECESEFVLMNFCLGRSRDTDTL